MSTPAFPPLRRLTADEVLRMVDLGILGEDEPVELFDGVLVQMSPQGPMHAEATSRLADKLRGAYLGKGRVREEKPMAAGTYSLPEPDIAVVRGEAGAYLQRHPSGADTILVVELAWSSQEVDRRKADLYAAAGVPFYWLVDLAARKLELRARPDAGAYGLVTILGESEVVAVPELGEQWRVRDLLP